MRYRSGELARLGDRVRLGDQEGAVLFSIDTGEFPSDYRREEWADFLKEGIMIKFPAYGLIHYTEPDEDLEFVGRATEPRSGF